MATALLAPQVRTLAELDAGEHMQVTHIIFDAVRAHCAGVGLFEGTAVTCLANADRYLLLDLAGSGSIVIDRQWTRFVEVEPV